MLMTTFSPGSYASERHRFVECRAPGNFLDSLWPGDTELLISGCGAEAGCGSNHNTCSLSSRFWAYILKRFGSGTLVCRDRALSRKMSVTFRYLQR